MHQHELFMGRCLQLAKLGALSVAPNPMVGAVLVYNGRIIGEGYHRQYGQPHAEVNCIDSVAENEEPLISQSTLYVSLEPCAHFGKTPPCADLIIRHSIPNVVVGCRDPFEQVNGKGIEKLQAAGITVTVGVLENDCIELNRRFFTFHTKKRPYVLLKWAQSGNKMIGSKSGERVLISDEFTNRLVHKWRAEEMGIMVGTNTAWADDPKLNNRLWAGGSPVRIIVDLNLRLPLSLQAFNSQQTTIVINHLKNEVKGTIDYCQVDSSMPLAAQVMDICYSRNVTSVMIEGGSRLLQTFIDAGLWDEARVIENPSLIIHDGVMAPKLSNQKYVRLHRLMNDTITIYHPQKS